MIATHPPFGAGAYAELDGLLISVNVSHSGWAYTISRDGSKIAEHDPVWPDNDREERARIEAVTKALEILRRTVDPAELAAKLQWKPSAPKGM